MIDFNLPWIFLLLPLPLLVWWLLPPSPEGRGGALRVPFFDAVDAAPESGGGRQRSIALIKVLAWLLLVTAAAQPRWIGEPRTITSSGRDLLLALDISGSMASEDFDVNGRAVDRLTVVSAVARDFVGQRVGDRVGLVLFGSRAYLQAPLTFDRQTVIEMIGESEIGLAGEETAIGDAVGVAVKHLRRAGDPQTADPEGSRSPELSLEPPAEERVLVLLSDGANNAGVLDPERAAEIAADQGIRIYTIGIGSGHQVVQTPFGPQAVPAPAELDETTLSAMAGTTGGAYFRARDTNALVDVYRQIDALELTDGEAQTVRPTRELFYWPLAAALALATLLLLARVAREISGVFQRPEEGVARS